MNRRSWVKQTSLAAGAAAMIPGLQAFGPENKTRSKLVLKIAHITDVHIRPEENVPDRFSICLNEIKKHDVDFFLNGGDSIHDASYDDVKRERVAEQWDAWDECINQIGSCEMYSCLGNHDIWWAAPSREDEMYGKEYAVKRLSIPGRYYSFSKNGWHFIILDSNNQDNYSLDQEQFNWLEKELEGLPADTPSLLMSHCPMLGVTGHFYPGDQHADFKRLKDLFYRHKDKVRVCLSGHMHLLDHAVYNGVQYFCNGAMSGYWWGKGDGQSAMPGYYHETPPGYAILELYANGTVENNYHPHTH